MEGKGRKKKTSDDWERKARAFLGHLAVAGIECVKKIPPGVSLRILKPLLPLYFLARIRQVKAVRDKIAASPFAGRLTLWSYYSTRLKLLLGAIHQHGQTAILKNVIVENEDILKEALEQKKPILLVGLHLGPFELLHKAPLSVIQKNNRLFAVLTAPSFSRPLDRYLELGRIAPGKTMVKPNQAGGAIRKFLRGGAVLAVMSDQAPESDAHRLILWGTFSVPYPQKLITNTMKREACLLPISCRENNGSIRLTYHPIIDGSIRPEDVRQRLAGIFEHEIEKAPGQWNWSYPGIRRL